MSKIALGRGFEGLIPVGFDVSQVAGSGEQIKQIQLSKIVANPDQPRKEFDEGSLNELAQSIKEHGIIQPLVVTETGSGVFRIVAGERRFRASKIAGLDRVPAVVRDHKELEELEIALVENVQRVDLSPIEQAISVIKLRDQFSLSPKEIAKKLGKAETTVSNMVRLLHLPKEALLALQKQEISEGHARAILALKADENLQKKLLNIIITQKISVREAEAFVKSNRPKDKNAPKLDAVTEGIYSGLNEGAKPFVSIHTKPSTRKASGYLKLRYTNESQLQRIIKLLNSEYR